MNIDKRLPHEFGFIKFINELVIPEIILAKINNDIPLEIHFSVIISPNHISKTVHTVKANAADNTIAKLLVFITHGI